MIGDPDPDDPLSDRMWLTLMSASGPRYDDAIARLHALMLKAARTRVYAMDSVKRMDSVRREEAIHAAADAAVVSLLRRLHTFEGRSRFTTWAYAFAVHHVGVEVRRAAWKGREVQLDLAPDQRATNKSEAPEVYVECRDLADAVLGAMDAALTAHQRNVAVALLVDEVPVSVLAERLGTTRGALYKTLHDARRRLRADLHRRGYLESNTEGGRRR